MSIDAILLFGHGARNREYLAPFERIRAEIQSIQPAVKVAIGFLELSAPLLEDAVANLLSVGARSIRIVPIFFAPGRHVQKDLPLRAAELLERYPTLQLEIAACVGASDRVIQAMARYAIGP